ncbi:hypothetical protein DENSPDRAFT_886675 [Dentipellis sp. KUC8613]|nr:hypothetical protein DENSPDRAFT_886675 [Dentipellis sp. KUC8613]
MPFRDPSATPFVARPHLVSRARALMPTFLRAHPCPFSGSRLAFLARSRLHAALPFPCARPSSRVRAPSCVRAFSRPPRHALIAPSHAHVPSCPLRASRPVSRPHHALVASRRVCAPTHPRTLVPVHLRAVALSRPSRPLRAVAPLLFHLVLVHVRPPPRPRALAPSCPSRRHPIVAFPPSAPLGRHARRAVAAFVPLVPLHISAGALAPSSCPYAPPSCTSHSRRASRLRRRASRLRRRASCLRHRPYAPPSCPYALPSCPYAPPSRPSPLRVAPTHRRRASRPAPSSCPYAPPSCASRLRRRASRICRAIAPVVPLPPRLAPTRRLRSCCAIACLGRFSCALVSPLRVSILRLMQLSRRCASRLVPRRLALSHACILVYM